MCDKNNEFCFESLLISDWWSEKVQIGIITNNVETLCYKKRDNMKSELRT